jgi:predicted ArsR family transcriptional regulator
VTPVPPGTTVAEAKEIGEQNRRIILDALHALDGEEPPTIRALAAYVGLSVTATYAHLQILAARGDVSREVYPARCPHCTGTGTIATHKYVPR